MEQGVSSNHVGFRDEGNCTAPQALLPSPPKACMGLTMVTSLVRWYSRAQQQDPDCYCVRIDTSKFLGVDEPGNDGHGYGSSPLPQAQAFGSQPGLSPRAR